MRQEYERLRGIMARIEAYEIMIKVPNQFLTISFLTNIPQLLCH